MELALLFYLADITRSLSLTLALVGAALVFILGVIILVTLDTNPKEKDLVKRCCWLSIIPAVLFLVATLLPSKQGIYQMAAAYGVQAAATNPDVQRLAGKSLQVLENSLDKYLKEDKKDE